MRNCAYALMAVMLLSACGHVQTVSKPERERQEQAERILERTITEKGETVTQTLYKYIKLPEDLTKPCPATHNKDRSVGEYVRVANHNTPILENCDARMAEIRKLQDQAVK